MNHVEKMANEKCSTKYCELIQEEKHRTTDKKIAFLKLFGMNEKMVDSSSEALGNHLCRCLLFFSE